MLGFVAFTVALYMQAEKTESTLFNTLTEKKSQYTKFLHRLYVYEEWRETGFNRTYIQIFRCTRQIIGRHQLSERYIRYWDANGKGNPESSFEVNVMNVSTNFFQFMNIPLLSGHTLKAKEDLVVDKTWAERQKKIC